MLIQLIGECNVTDEKKRANTVLPIFNRVGSQFAKIWRGKALSTGANRFNSKRFVWQWGLLVQVIHDYDGRNNMIRQLR
jgi:hypothetical protein